MLTHSDVLFVSHGGGPLPLLDDPGHIELVEALGHLTKRIEKPEAILVLSAHWESDVLRISAGARPGLLYDYAGFPEESYAIQYPCPGSPALAKRVRQALQQSGIKVELDDERGLDHGVFVPLKLMYPQADIPVVQLSIYNDLDAEKHIELGEALAKLEEQRLLILGSGFTFHNMRAFYTPQSEEMRTANGAFEDWLQQSVASKKVSGPEARARLVSWEQAPYARFCQPREEHLLPLHVCFGVAGRSADAYQRLVVFHKECSLYHWELR